MGEAGKVVWKPARPFALVEISLFVVPGGTERRVARFVPMPATDLSGNLR